MTRKRDYSSRHAPYAKRRRPPPEPVEEEEDRPTLRPAPPSAVVVMGLPQECSVLDLKSRFEIYGPIARIRIDRDAVGYITYRTKDSADAAIAAGADTSFGITIHSKKVQVLWATDPLAMWREGVGNNKDKGSMSKLVRAEVPLRRHGRGNRLASAIGNTKTSEDSSDGKVLSWGRGNSGQLGHGEVVNNSLYPKPVTSLDSYFITNVSAGWSHSGFVSDTGCLFTCGDGSFGQLGLGDYASHSSPVKVSRFDDQRVARVACGMRHSLVLLEVDGHLYTWGRGFKGFEDAQSPQRLNTTLNFAKVSMGWNHALALTGEGEAYILGGNHLGVLNDHQNMNPAKQLPDSREASLEKVPGLNGTKIVDIATGAEHSALITENGEVKTWGWGEHGQLGLGDTCDRASPVTVSLGHDTDEVKSIRVYCGSGFTFALTTKP